MTEETYEFEGIPEPSDDLLESKSKREELGEPLGYKPSPHRPTRGGGGISKYILSGGGLIAVSLAIFAGYKIYVYEQLLSANELASVPSGTSEFKSDYLSQSMEPRSESRPFQEGDEHGANPAVQRRVLNTTEQWAEAKVSAMESGSRLDTPYEPSVYPESKEKPISREATYNPIKEFRVTSSHLETDDEWVISQLKSNAIENGKKILQLEAQVALLQLDLTKQKSESFSAMQAASEAATTLLAMREVLRKLNSQVRTLGGKIDANEKNYASLLKTIEPKLGRLEKRVVQKENFKKSTVSEVHTEVTPKEDLQRKHMRSYSTVMVNDRAAFVLNVHSNERRVLEIGSKYPDLGRVEGVSRDENSVFGVTNDGLSWIIKKTGS